MSWGSAEPDFPPTFCHEENLEAWCAARGLEAAAEERATEPLPCPKGAGLCALTGGPTGGRGGEAYEFHCEDHYDGAEDGGGELLRGFGRNRALAVEDWNACVEAWREGQGL